jgi:hypothetical protein
MYRKIANAFAKNGTKPYSTSNLRIVCLVDETWQVQAEINGNVKLLETGTGESPNP